jgi:hypothetical protein
MAKRPIFIPIIEFPYIKELFFEFEWFPGFAKSQAQKSISSLHSAAARQGISPVLEISSKSSNPLGLFLSAFNLTITMKTGEAISVECAFQGSKIFERGGPYTDLYFAQSKDAKTDHRIRTSGNIIKFSFCGDEFPIEPTRAFYDWLYITALWQNSSLSRGLMAYKGFSDIAFNPKKSWNCQAHSAALFVSLSQKGILESAMQDKDYFITFLTNRGIQSKPKGKQLKLEY